MVKQEIFKDIIGYEGLYQISNMGRVKSLERTIKNGPGVRKVRERILEPWVGKTGYLSIPLYKDKKGKTYYVARLVALHFIPNPENKRTVNHKKGIKSDNRAKKLEWMTYGENHTHAYSELKRTPPLLGKRGVDCANSRKVVQYDLDDNFIAEYNGQREAFRETGIYQANISKVCLGKRNHAGGFIWKHKK